MRRLLLFVLLALPFTSPDAQTSPDLAGTWDVERLHDPAAAPAAEGSLSALLPDNPYAMAPTRLRLGADGDATVTLLVARQGGYEMVDVAGRLDAEAGRATVTLGDLALPFAMAHRGDRLTLTASDGSVLTLRRTARS